MTDCDELVDVVATEGAELVLHGHHHCRMVNFIETKATRAVGSRIPILGAPAASATRRDDAHRAAYHMITLSDSGGAIEITARARGPSRNGREVIDLGALL